MSHREVISHSVLWKELLIKNWQTYMASLPMGSSEPACFISETVAINKRGSVKRHYYTEHRAPIEQTCLVSMGTVR